MSNDTNENVDAVAKQEAEDYAYRQLSKATPLPPDQVFSYEDLQERPALLYYEVLTIDYDTWYDKLLRLTPTLSAYIVEPETIDQWGVETGSIWEGSPVEPLHALLLIHSLDRTGGPAGPDPMLFSCCVVWKSANQSCIPVATGIRAILEARAAGIEYAVLCKIPTTRPLWPYCSAGGHPFIMPMAGPHITGGPLTDFRAYHMISHSLSCGEMVAFNRSLSGSKDDDSTRIYFKAVVGCGLLWANENYYTVGGNGSTIPALNTVTLVDVHVPDPQPEDVLPAPASTSVVTPASTTTTTTAATSATTTTIESIPPPGVVMMDSTLFNGPAAGTNSAPDSTDPTNPAPTNLPVKQLGTGQSALRVQMKWPWTKIRRLTPPLLLSVVRYRQF